jgi:hypothetical protein
VWPEVPDVLVIATLKGPVFILDMKGQVKEFRDCGLDRLLADSVHFKLTYDFCSVWKHLNAQASFDFNFIVDYTVLWECYQRSIGFGTSFPASIVRFCEMSSPSPILYVEQYQDPEARVAVRATRPLPQSFIDFSGSVAEVILMAWFCNVYPESIKTEAIELTHFMKRELELLPEATQPKVEGTQVQRYFSQQSKS